MTITIIIIVIIKNFVVFVLKLNIFQHLFIEWVSERKIQIFSFFNCLYTHLNKFCLSNPHIFRYLLWFVHQDTILIFVSLFFLSPILVSKLLAKKKKWWKIEQNFFFLFLHSCFFLILILSFSPPPTHQIYDIIWVIWLWERERFWVYLHQTLYFCLVSFVVIVAVIHSFIHSIVSYSRFPQPILIQWGLRCACMLKMKWNSSSCGVYFGF